MRLRVRIVLLLLFAVLVCWSLPASATTESTVIVSLASSNARLDAELPIALRSLIRQHTVPAEIRVYLPLAERDAVMARVQGNGPSLPSVFSHPRVRLLFTEDVGPATKFVPVLQELSAAHNLDHPVIVVDDDHYYSPALVGTLLSAHSAHPNASVGLRGWRVREDLEWGVAGDAEYNRHVLLAHRMADPFRVGVLTANEGYLITPRMLPAAALDTSALSTTSAHLVDDIWMAGQLATAHTPRLLVPLHAPPSVDITRSHTLETHMAADGVSRAEANGATLSMFGPAFAAEGIWYRFAKDVRRGARGIILDVDEPVWAGLLTRKWREGWAWWTGMCVQAGRL